MNKEEKTSNAKRRVVALLSREEIEFIEKLGIDSLFSTGIRLSRVEIVAALIDAAIALGITAEGISTKDELVSRILSSFRVQAEKRRYPRIKKNLQVGVRKMDSLVEYANCMTKDVSLGGFKIEACFLDNPPKINQIIEIMINDPCQKDEPIKAIGRVAWIKENQAERTHEIGVCLTYIKEEDKEKFMQCLQEGAEIK